MIEWKMNSLESFQVFIAALLSLCSQLLWFTSMAIELSKFILSSQSIDSFREEMGTGFGSTWDKIQEVKHVETGSLTEPEAYQFS